MVQVLQLNPEPVLQQACEPETHNPNPEALKPKLQTTERAGRGPAQRLPGLGAVPLEAKLGFRAQGSWGPPKGLEGFT